MTIYTGKWGDGLTHYLDRLPHLKTFDAYELFRYAMANKGELDGVWTNSVMMLQAFDPHEVVVILADGRGVRLSDVPGAMKQSEVLDTGELYINTNWDAIK